MDPVEFIVACRYLGKRPVRWVQMVESRDAGQSRDDPPGVKTTVPSTVAELAAMVNGMK